VGVGVEVGWCAGSRASHPSCSTKKEANTPMPTTAGGAPPAALHRQRSVPGLTLRRVSALPCAVLCCAVLRCAALRCPALRCAALCCAVLCHVFLSTRSSNPDQPNSINTTLLTNPNPHKPQPNPTRRYIYDFTFFKPGPIDPKTFAVPDICPKKPTAATSGDAAASSSAAAASAGASGAMRGDGAAAGAEAAADSALSSVINLLRSMFGGETSSRSSSSGDSGSGSGDPVSLAVALLPGAVLTHRGESSHGWMGGDGLEQLAGVGVTARCGKQTVGGGMAHVTCIHPLHPMECTAPHLISPPHRPSALLWIQSAAREAARQRAATGCPLGCLHHQQSQGACFAVRCTRWCVWDLCRSSFVGEHVNALVWVWCGRCTFDQLLVASTHQSSPHQPSPPRNIPTPKPNQRTSRNPQHTHPCCRS